MYLFPYTFVDKGVRIILYAAGDVGVCYYHQLRLSSYAECVLWVDKNPPYKEVSNIDLLCSMNENEYDCVLIALLNDKIADKVKQLLIQQGIPEFKILYFPPQYVQHYQLSRMTRSLTLSDLLYDDLIIQKGISDFFLTSDGDIGFFYDLKDEIAKFAFGNKDNTHKMIERIKYVVDHVLVLAEEKLVLLQLAWSVHCFDLELFRRYFIFTSEIVGNSSKKYWHITQLIQMPFLSPDLYYSGFANDLLSLQDSLIGELKLRWQPPQYVVSSRSICILLPSCKGNQVDFSMAPIAIKLSQKGYHIHIINLYGWQVDDIGATLWGNSSKFDDDRLIKEVKIKFYPDPIEVHYASALTFRARQQQILDIICSINPLCVIDASGDYGILSSIFTNNYPTIYRPQRRQWENNSHFHKLIITGYEPSEKHNIPEERIIRIYPLQAIPEMKCRRVRKELNLENDDIVCVTVGTRLEYDIKSDLIDCMFRAMTANPQIKWLIVGVEKLKHIDKYYAEEAQNQIRFILYEEDLAGLYEICDVYINPNRTGGGTSCMYAMQSGMVLLTPRTAADASNLLPLEWMYDDEAEMVDELAKLSNNLELLTEKKRQMKELADEWDVNKSIDNIENAMLEMAGKFQNGSYENVQ